MDKHSNGNEDPCDSRIRELFPHGVLESMAIGQGLSEGVPFRMGPTICKALAQAQALAPAIQKDGTVTGGARPYKYSSWTMVAEEARKLLAAHSLLYVRLGVSIEQNYQPNVDENGNQYMEFVGKVSCLYQLVHETGESMPAKVVEFPFVPGKGRPPDKAAGAALSNAHKYALAGVLNLAWEGEEEANGRRGGRDVPRSTQRRVSGPAQQQKPQPQQPQPQPRGRTQANPKYQQRAQVARAAVKESGLGLEAALQCATGLQSARDLPGGMYPASVYLAVSTYCEAAKVAQDTRGEILNTHEAFLEWMSEHHGAALWGSGQRTEAGQALDKTEPPTLPA